MVDILTFTRIMLDFVTFSRMTQQNYLRSKSTHFNTKGLLTLALVVQLTEVNNGVVKQQLEVQ